MWVTRETTSITLCVTHAPLPPFTQAEALRRAFVQRTNTMHHQAQAFLARRVALYQPLLQVLIREPESIVVAVWMTTSTHPSIHTHIHIHRRRRGPGPRSSSSRRRTRAWG